MCSNAWRVSPVLKVCTLPFAFFPAQLPSLTSAASDNACLGLVINAFFPSSSPPFKNSALFVQLLISVPSILSLHTCPAPQYTYLPSFVSLTSSFHLFHPFSPLFILLSPFPHVWASLHRQCWYFMNFSSFLRTTPSFFHPAFSAYQF